MPHDERTVDQNREGSSSVEAQRDSSAPPIVGGRDHRTEDLLGSSKRNRPRRPHAAPNKPSPGARTRQAATPAAEPAVEGEPTLERLWDSSRAGATAGRGFRYQDLVGAWVGLQLGVGIADGEQLTPEGLDDLTIEGDRPLQMQVKSRYGGRRDFTASEAAWFIVALWIRHQGRDSDAGAAAADDRFVLILERSISGWAPDQLDAPLATATGDQVDRIRNTLRKHAAAEPSLNEASVDELLRRTTVLVLPASVLKQQSAELISARTGLPTGATSLVLQAVRAAVGEHSDRNVGVKHDQRAGLDLTAITRIVTNTTAFVDHAALAEAVANGSCSVVDFDTPLNDSAFYAGTSVQPGHVAAGLVIARREPVTEILTGLLDGRPVLVRGASGVGKSAVAWLAAHEARHITWYQIHRLGTEDVEPITRLAQAAGAGRFGPVGFVVDGVGTGMLAAWDELHRRVRTIPGMLLLGSVREEDTIQLATLPDTVVVRPILDEDLAARIHDKLVTGGLTSLPHWQEAFEASGGLTLEYTHLLTSGRRLDEVITDQVEARVREGRSIELAVLALVCSADRWGVPLASEQVRTLIGVPDIDLRLVLDRLVREHMLVIDGETIIGLHRLRSQAASVAVHRTPPPTLSGTLAKLISAVDAVALPTLIGRAATDEPSLCGHIAEQLHARTAGSDTAATAAALSAARLADHTVTARRIVDTLEKHSVPLPHQPLAIDLSLLGQEVSSMLSLPLLPQITAAVEENVRAAQCHEALADTVLDELLDRFEADHIVSLLGAANVQQAAELLDPLAGTGLTLTVDAGSHLARALATATLTDLADLIEAATAVSLATGLTVLEAAGGEHRIVELLAESDWTVLHLDVVEIDESPGQEAEGSGDGADGEPKPGRALDGTLIFVSDQVTPDARDRIVSVAKLGLRCLPTVAKADLRTVLAGGAPYAIGDFEPASSGLLRRYALGDRTIRWNRLRAGYAKSLIRSSSTTQRLAAGSSALHDATQFLTELADFWIRARRARATPGRLIERRQELIRRIQVLEPDMRALGEGGGPAVEQLEATLAANAEIIQPLDVLHTLARGTVENIAGRLADASGYGSLAAFAKDTLGSRIGDAEVLPWSLLGLAEAPAYLAELDRLLGSIAAICAEIALGQTDVADIVASTRASRHRQAVHDAADFVTGRAQDRLARRLAELERAAAAGGYPSTTHMRAASHEKVTLWPPVEIAVTFEVSEVDAAQFLQALPALLEQHLGQTASVAVIPIVSGRPSARGTHRVFATGGAYPLPHAADAWLEQLGQPLRMPLTDAVSTALQALAEVSALVELRHLRESDAGQDEIQAAVNKAVGEYNRALEQIRVLGSDTVTGALLVELDSVAVRVEAEGAGSGAAESSWAALQFGAAGNDAARGLLILAAEWDVDPSAAERVLASVTD